jgi:hypothetical protein
MKITIYWDMATFTVEESSTLKMNAAGSLRGQEISTKLLDVTPQKIIIFNKEYPILTGKENYYHRTLYLIYNKSIIAVTKHYMLCELSRVSKNAHQKHTQYIHVVDFVLLHCFILKYV